ncbi:mitochondrial fission ELM1 family protein [Roseococcus sp.]|uniref:mitochondrial fission ELM1 family protein n=1 Tax=Roseococcus sp. TaxID=2109646 RepID=UPI003BAB4262
MTVWVLEDPRAGTAAQALGIAERLGLPFRRIPLRFGPWAKLPWPWATLAGLANRSSIAPPWPELVISAGRRAAPVSRWLRARGVRTVHAMRPGFGAHDFDLLVIGAHDAPARADNVMVIQGAAHRLTPGTLAAAPAQFPELAALPAPRVALLLGGPVRAENMAPEVAAEIARQAAGLGASVMATASRRTGVTASEAVAKSLSGTPHHLHRWGGADPNPFLAMLALAQRIVVTGDSISMLSEALMTTAPLLIADPGGLGPRHRAMADGLIAAGLAARLGEALPPPREALDETGRIVAEIHARGLVR